MISENTKAQLTSQSSGRRFRIRHFRNFRVGRSVSPNLLKVIVLINKLAKRVCEENYTRFA